MARMQTTTKLTDAKGRITLGSDFADKTFLVEQDGSVFTLRLAKVIPEAEAWLYDNPVALEAVRQGLQQARLGTYAKKAPDLTKARRIADANGDADEETLSSRRAKAPSKKKAKRS